MIVTSKTICVVLEIKTKNHMKFAFVKYQPQYEWKLTSQEDIDVCIPKNSLSNFASAHFCYYKSSKSSKIMLTS